MLGGIKKMLGFKTSSRERPNPDILTGQVVIAAQRNERASENARAVLNDLLSRNDNLRRHK